jgi:hypothetical protein
MISAGILIALNVLSLLSNLFFVFSIDTFSHLVIPYGRGANVLRIDLDQKSLVFLTLIKSVVNLILIRWAVSAIRTFKPIVKQIHKEETFVQQPAHDRQAHSMPRSKAIKAYQKKVAKILIVTLVLMFAGCLYARCFAISTAD